MTQLLGKLNPSFSLVKYNKTVYRVKEVEVLGCMLSSNGIQSSPPVVSALLQCLTPANKWLLCSFLGMVGYYRTFIPSFADISAPLYALFNQDTTFHWNGIHQRAFEQLREAAKSNVLLAFYDTSPATKTIFTTDASLQGLGWVLTQVRDGIEKPVYFISRKLQPGDTKYSSSESETLAVLWCEAPASISVRASFWNQTDYCALREVLKNLRDLWHQLQLSDGQLNYCPKTSLLHTLSHHSIMHSRSAMFGHTWTIPLTFEG